MYAIIYKEDMKKKVWESLVNELGLPKDTDEISIKMTSYMTKRNRKSIKESQKTVKT